ncbi:MAG: hypothetical protein PHR96_02415 [Clostridia bacterium]|nr:hypothetical protein [Clostridia bacterium]
MKIKKSNSRQEVYFRCFKHARGRVNLKCTCKVSRKKCVVQNISSKGYMRCTSKRFELKPLEKSKFSKLIEYYISRGCELKRIYTQGQILIWFEF